MTLQCQNCPSQFDDNRSLDLIDAIWERVEPGEPMPEGQCPDCGALVHRKPEERLNKDIPLNEKQTALDTEIDRQRTIWTDDIEEILYDALEAWQTRFPKRSLRFSDAMGRVTVIVGNRYVVAPDDCYVEEEIMADEVIPMMEPLREILNWYEHKARELQVVVDDFTIDPKEN